MIYLAAPYSHPEISVRVDRVRRINSVFAKLCLRGNVVFSTLSMTHEAAIAHDLPADAAYWDKMNTAFLKNCSRMFVLCLPGWHKSLGVTEEIRLAKRLHIYVCYINEQCDILSHDELPQ